jgi:hypothetical protein
MTQRMEALEHANRIRIERSRLKKSIQRRELSAADVLRDPPEFTASMLVFDLLCAVPRWGDAKTKGVLNGLGVSHSRAVGGLSARQRELLALVVERGSCR